MDSNRLRAAFTRFFVERGHLAVSSASLIPHDPTLLFTVAGMVPFKGYFAGDEVPPAPRLVSVQRCLRVSGRHDDIEAIGRSTRHLTLLEMLGNFSFGDYFKSEAIPWAYELVTEVLGLDPERLWVTVHDSDDEAEFIWADGVGLSPARIQRMGDDNFWRMGETGPCGPSSELFWDKGEAYGPGGGPAKGSEERFVEFWNLVFTQYYQRSDETLVELPRKNIDTGAGLERLACILQGVDSVFDTDLMAPLVRSAAAITGRRYGAEPSSDVRLRILADHARSASFLIGDGVFPSNEGRGYVLRRIIRRAVRHAHQLGVSTQVMAPLSATVVEVMGEAYPELARQGDFVHGILEREEARFRQTLRTGLAILDTELSSVGGGGLSGPVAFRLHDTHGFPIDLTAEIAAERGVGVDVVGFAEEMAAQRARARAAGGAVGADLDRLVRYRAMLEEFGTTEFRGYEGCATTGHILQIGDGELFLDVTPFYAEGGGQVGDTGFVTTDTGRARVTDTTAALPGLIRHHVVIEGEMWPGQEAIAEVDAERRAAIRRNHTATHVMQWALREVLGSHVAQQGSLVAPDRLRFDFSHFGGLSAAEIERVEDLVNAAVLANDTVVTEEVSRSEADALGAIAFFGDRYGERVRVVRAGRSVELCGGTHVSSLGAVGMVKIVSEASIGANTRRIEALTGKVSLAHVREEERLLVRTAELLRAPQVADVPEWVERLVERARATSEELKALRVQATRGEAAALASAATDGVVVARRDGASSEELRSLAVAVRDRAGVRAVVLIGSPDGKGVALVAAVSKASGLVASELLSGAARLVGGGGGRDPELAIAGGRNAERIDEALRLVQVQLGLEGGGREAPGPGPEPREAPGPGQVQL
jgi:alanyl-tRNA synthetase